MSTDQAPRDILSGKPFYNKAVDYHKAGWFPIPLKPKKKEPQQGGYTGRKNEFPKDELAKIIEWRDEVPDRCNIGIWLRDGVIGIDVDAYTSGTDSKIHGGGTTLKELERKLGELPDTWISTARSDGISGIRFYKIPKKLEWSGKAGDGIDIIQRVHRYAAVYPSHHPSGDTYRWYPPGAELNGTPEPVMQKTSEKIDGGFRHVMVSTEILIPQQESIPELPAPWVEFLTKGFTEASDTPIDMDLSTSEIDAWAVKNLAKPARQPRSKWCSGLEKSYKYWIEQIKEDMSSHDKVRDAHWQFIQMGKEGHKGWLTAVMLIEKYWTKDVIQRGKRDIAGARMEMKRSRWNAERKLKGQFDLAANQGFSFLTPRCACFKESEVSEEGSQAVPKPKGTATDPTAYRLNDDGNAEHLHDLYGNDLIWIETYQKWLFWDGKRWIRDEDGLARRCYWKVRDRQENAVASCSSGCGS